MIVKMELTKEEVDELFDSDYPDGAIPSNTRLAKPVREWLDESLREGSWCYQLQYSSPSFYTGAIFTFNWEHGAVAFKLRWL